MRLERQQNDLVVPCCTAKANKRVYLHGGHTILEENLILRQFGLLSELMMLKEKMKANKKGKKS